MNKNGRGVFYSFVAGFSVGRYFIHGLKSRFTFRIQAQNAGKGRRTDGQVGTHTHTRARIYVWKEY